MKLTSLICGACLAALLSPAFAQPPNFQTEMVADAKPGDVRVFVTRAIDAPLKSIKEQAEKAIGKHILFEYGSARGNLKDEILKGTGDFELAMLLPDVDETLLAAGKIKPGAYEIARVPIAFGVRGDSSAVDLSTPEAVKKTLLGATSVKYASTGAALLTVKKVLGDLQIADKVKDYSKTDDEVKLTGKQYEIDIYPLSEILQRKDLKNMGPVIDELQVPSIIEATVGANTRDEASARALIKFLQGPAINPGLKDAGMVKGKIVASK